MKISVIIPTFNESKRIGKLLDHLFDQANDALLEVIVVDGGSTDGTVEMVNQHLDAQLIHSGKGRAVQMNAAAAIAKGDVLYFLHADSWPPKSYLNDILEATSLGHVAGSYRFQFDNSRFLLAINSFFTRFGALFCRGGDQSMFILKETFDELNGFDESYVIMEDYDFIIRFSEQHEFYVIPKNIIVSDRKYKSNSYLRVQIANLIAFTMFRRGASRQRIKSVYERMLDLSAK